VTDVTRNAKVWARTSEYIFRHTPILLDICFMLLRLKSGISTTFFTKSAQPYSHKVYLSHRIHMASSTAPAKTTEVPWHAAYPAVRALDLPSITCAELLRWYKEGKSPGSEFVLVDLRRTDHEVPLLCLHPCPLCFTSILSPLSSQTSLHFLPSQMFPPFHFSMQAYI
jgi:hypothetical protein